MSKSAAKMKRSDSSYVIREQLKQSFVKVPEISTKVTLISYIHLARNLYFSSLESIKKGDFKRAYVDLYMFNQLALREIPTHVDYKSNSTKIHDDKRWLENTKSTAMLNLEFVVEQLDIEEDKRLLHSDDYNLIDEFDSIEFNNTYNNNNKNNNNNNNSVVKSSPDIINSSTTSAKYCNTTVSSPFDSNKEVLIPLPAAVSPAVSISSINTSTLMHTKPANSFTTTTAYIIEEQQHKRLASAAGATTYNPIINQSNIG